MQRNKQLQFMLPDTSPGGPRSDVLCLILISVPLVYNTARLGLESHVKVSALQGHDQRLSTILDTCLSTLRLCLPLL